MFRLLMITHYTQTRARPALSASEASLSPFGGLRTFRDGTRPMVHENPALAAAYAL